MDGSISKSLAYTGGSAILYTLSVPLCPSCLSTSPGDTPPRYVFHIIRLVSMWEGISPELQLTSFEVSSPLLPLPSHIPLCRGYTTHYNEFSPLFAAVIPIREGTGHNRKGTNKTRPYICLLMRVSLCTRRVLFPKPQ